MVELPSAWVLLWIIQISGGGVSSGAAYFGTLEACERAKSAYEAMEARFQHGRWVETDCVEDPLPADF